MFKIFWLFNKQQERESVEFILGEKKHFGTFSGPPEVQQILAWVRISGIFFYMRREAQKTLFFDSYYCPRLIRLFLLFCTDLLSSEANQLNCPLCHYTNGCDNVNNFSLSLLHHFHFTRKPEILKSTWPICEKKKIQKAKLWGFLTRKLIRRSIFHNKILISRLKDIRNPKS